MWSFVAPWIACSVQRTVKQWTANLNSLPHLSSFIPHPPLSAHNGCPIISRHCRCYFIHMAYDRVPAAPPHEAYRRFHLWAHGAGGELSVRLKFLGIRDGQHREEPFRRGAVVEGYSWHIGG